MQARRNPLDRYVRVRLAPHDIELAKTSEAAVLRNLRRVPNYTGLDERSRYFIGYAGELAVVRWLAGAGLAPRHSIVTNGRSQGADIECGGVRIEVKTAGNPGRRELWIPQAQALDFDVCVGAVLIESSEAVDIMGWATREEVSRFRIVDPPSHGMKITNRLCEFYLLAHPADLLAAIARGRLA